MTQQTEKPCHWCDLPESAHPVYRQIDGEHDYEPRIDEPPIAAPDRPRERPCTCATSDQPGQHHCGPSAQLPPRREDTERARDWPAYQSGRVPTDETLRNLAEAARGPTTDEIEENVGRLAEAMRGPLPPVPEQSYPPGAQDLPTDRPGLLRRIWDAARKASR